LNVPTGVYRTRDGWIIVALVREEQYVRLVGALGRPDLATDTRFADFGARAAHAALLCDIVGSILLGDTTEGWLARLRAADILADRIYGFDDWLADPHVAAIGGAVCVDQPGMGYFKTPRTPGIALAADAAMMPAPRIGEHGRTILAELGIDPPTTTRSITMSSIAASAVTPVHWRTVFRSSVARRQARATLLWRSATR
jgi:crotonobetainyl-CoA:carnitine CoA-transferase CaiB-like acyl-CoA transferase